MKKTIISTAFATASLFLIMGFTDNPQHNLVLSGENLVENLTDEQVTFVEKVSSNDVDYAGLYLYTDGNYNYYVDVDDNYISSVLPARDFQNDISTVNLIDESMACNVAEDYFDTIAGHLIVGNLETNVKEIVGIGWVIELTETVNNLETGTKASVIVNSNGNILTATVVNGDAEYISNLDKATLLTKEEASSLAVSALELDSAVEVISVVPSMEDLKTFKGKIFWKLVYPVKVNVDGVVYELNYYVDIDAISGNILEIAHDVY